MTEGENSSFCEPFERYAIGSVSGVRIRRGIDEGIVVDGFGRIVVRDVDYGKITVAVEKDEVEGECLEATLEFGSIYKCGKGMLTVTNVGRFDAPNVEFCMHFSREISFRPDNFSK